jgi:hypothetical protein
VGVAPPQAARTEKQAKTAAERVRSGTAAA